MKLGTKVAKMLSVVPLLLLCRSALAEPCQIYLEDQRIQGAGAVTFCIRIDGAPNAVDAFGLDLLYDSSVLTFTEAWSEGELVSGFEFLDVNLLENGHIRVGGFTISNSIAAGSSGILVCLDFTANACGNTTLVLDSFVNDISDWSHCNGNLICESALTQIMLKSPPNQSTLSEAPTFTWATDGGTNNFFAVDLALAPTGPIYSTYENLHQLIDEMRWVMPDSIWNMIPSGRRAYWRVRGVDLDASPQKIVTSQEVWTFTKE